MSFLWRTRLPPVLREDPRSRSIPWVCVELPQWQPHSSVTRRGCGQGEERGPMAAAIIGNSFQTGFNYGEIWPGIYSIQNQDCPALCLHCCNTRSSDMSTSSSLVIFFPFSLLKGATKGSKSHLLKDKGFQGNVVIVLYHFVNVWYIPCTRSHLFYILSPSQEQPSSLLSHQ